MKLPLYTKFSNTISHKNKVIAQNNYPNCRSLISIIDWQTLLSLTNDRQRKLKKVLDTKQNSDIIDGMKAIVKIQMDNAAFEKPHTHFELSKILSKMADTVGRQVVEDVGHGCTEADSNGNYIAKLEIVED